ncbi:MAG TPA: class I SAM-dependent methyltransferase [Actinomycetota bacterium]|jgi:SAM-dependent methyltransferase
MTAEVHLRTARGTRLPLHLERWMGSPTSVEELLLERVIPPALDVGCGPGRLTLSLAQRGVPALGIDAAPTAVVIASGRGAPALRRSIFERLPGEGRWGTVILVDGNVGIGGDPPTLLARLARLLRPGGRALIEAEPPGAPTDRIRVRIETRSDSGPFFPWARVSIDDLPRLAVQAGFSVRETISSPDRRWFAVLERP